MPTRSPPRKYSPTHSSSARVPFPSKKKPMTTARNSVAAARPSAATSMAPDHAKAPWDSTCRRFRATARVGGDSATSVH